MPNYYSDPAGSADWIKVSDDPTLAALTVTAIKALSNPTYDQIITQVTNKDSKVTQEKPKALFSRK